MQRVLSACFCVLAAARLSLADTTAERNSLAAVHASTSGDKWELEDASQRWDVESSDHCSWFGVHCCLDGSDFGTAQPAANLGWQADTQATAGADVIIQCSTVGEVTSLALRSVGLNAVLPMVALLDLHAARVIDLSGNPGAPTGSPPSCSPACKVHHAAT